MSDFIILDKNEIESAFCGERRQYFAGNLKNPQNLPFIRSENVEMGTSIWLRDEPSIWTRKQENSMNLRREIFMRSGRERLMPRNLSRERK